MIRVRDTGIGMDREQLSRLFKPFTQVDDSYTRKVGGTGLGLNITRRFCELMGGDIAVESEPGQGSCFTMHLPSEPGLAQVAAEAEPAPERQSTEEARAAVGGGGPVLLVDDDVGTRERLRRILEKEGFLVTEAINGRHGLERLEAETPRLILLDIMMPRLDGFDFITRLRSEAQWAEVPVIVITAKELTTSERQRLSRHVQRIFQKGSYSRSDLLDEVERLTT